MALLLFKFNSDHLRFRKGSCLHMNSCAYNSKEPSENWWAVSAKESSSAGQVRQQRIQNTTVIILNKFQTHSLFPLASPALQQRFFQSWMDNWTFKPALSQCTSHKLNRNYIGTVDWWLALTLAPPGGVGENYWELDQSQSSITSEELWGLGQWECCISAIEMG